MNRNLAAAALTAAALLSIAAPANAVTDVHGHHAVTLCHAHPADTAAGGWVQITIDAEGVAGDRQIAGHANEHGADIVPAFTYSNGDVFTGKNLGTVWGNSTGDEILANGCVIPAADPTPTETPTVTPTATPTPTVTPSTEPTPTATSTPSPTPTVTHKRTPHDPIGNLPPRRTWPSRPPELFTTKPVPNPLAPIGNIRTPGTVAPAPELAATGSPLIPAAGLGVLLLAVGGLIWLAGRPPRCPGRRRSS
jgi:hypothetical protein